MADDEYQKGWDAACAAIYSQCTQRQTAFARLSKLMEHMKAREIEAFHIANIVKDLMGTAGRREVTTQSPDELRQRIDATLLPLVERLNALATGKTQPASPMTDRDAFAFAGHELFRSVNLIWLLLRNRGRS